MSVTSSICREMEAFMSRPKTKAARLVAASAAAIACGVSLAGCSDIYLTHRETVGLSAGDAVAANEAMETVDPWPRNSGNNNLAFNGQRMQSAVERYRTNRVIPPVNATTSVIEAPPAEGAAVPASSGTQTAAGSSGAAAVAVEQQ
jgi:hypothetical protein